MHQYIVSHQSIPILFFDKKLKNKMLIIGTRIKLNINNMNTQFTDLSIPSTKRMYYYDPEICAYKFTHLMKLVLTVRKFPESMEMIKTILKEKPKQINKKIATV